MLKMTGCLFIILTCTGMGFYLSKMYRDRPKQIREWMTALKIIEAEIMYNATPILLLSKQLSNQTSPPCQMFFRTLNSELQKSSQSLAESWDKAMLHYEKYSVLKKKEISILLQFGHSLGKYNQREQEKHIQLTLKHLENEEADARDEQIKYEKMYRNLGFLLGLFIVLLLF